LLIAFMIASPWFLRNYVLLKNPVYPWFGKESSSIQFNYGNLQRLFVDNTFVGLANEDIGYVLLVFGLAGSIYLIWNKKNSLRMFGYFTLISFVLFIGAIIFYFGFERYLLMVAPMLAISSGYLLNKILSLNRLKIFAIIFIIIVTIPDYCYLVHFSTSSASPVLGNEVAYYIDSHLPRNAVILTNEICLYFINRDAINMLNLPIEFRKMENLTEAFNLLKSYNISHVLINSDIHVLENVVSLLKNTEMFKVLLNISSVHTTSYILYELMNFGEYETTSTIEKTDYSSDVSSFIVIKLQSYNEHCIEKSHK